MNYNRRSIIGKNSVKVINGEQLGTDVIHPVTFTRPDGFVCLDFGMLISDWSPGEYELEAGDYIYEYTVTVDK